MAPPNASRPTAPSQPVKKSMSSSASQSSQVTKSRSTSMSQPVMQKDKSAGVYGAGVSPRKRSPKAGRPRRSPGRVERPRPTSSVGASASTGGTGGGGESLMAKVSPKLLLIILGVCLYLLMPSNMRFVLLAFAVFVAYVIVFKPRFLTKIWQKCWPFGKKDTSEGRRVSGTRIAQESSSTTTEE